MSSSSIDQRPASRPRPKTNSRSDLEADLAPDIEPDPAPEVESAPTEDAPGGLAERRRRLGRRKMGGVAPMVRPPGRFRQWQASKHWGRRGFVPLSPGKVKRRHRILPRTVIGISTMLMSFGVGAAFSGAAFYAYYDNRLAENERQITRFVDGFDEQFSDASGALDDLRVEAVDQIRTELGPLAEYTSDAQGITQLPSTVGPSVWAVETRTESGLPVVGSAFAVTGHNGGTALITSLSVVRAGTASPSPGIELVKGDERLAATLWAWDEANNLAVIITDAEIPFVELSSPGEQVEAVGRRLFAVSGVGGQQATASPGVLLDRSSVGLQHTVRLGTFFEGGPLVNGDGALIGVATTDYRPTGVDPGDILQAPDVAALCNRVLRCAEGTTLSIELAEAGN